MAVFNKPLASGFTLQLELIQSSQDIGGNRTNLRVEGRIIKAAGTSAFSNFSNNWSITVNGVNYSGTFSYNFGSAASTLELLGTNQWVDHGSDGKKTVSGSMTVSTTNIGSGTASGSLPLTTIPRTSSFELSQSHTEAGSPVTITIAKASPGFRHDISVVVGTREETIAVNVDSSFVWTIDENYALQFPTSDRIFGSMMVRTKTGTNGSSIGTTFKPFAIVAGDAIRPTLTSLSVTETVTAHPGPAGNVNISTTVGAFVQGLSRPRVVMNGVGALHGATIVSSTVEVKTAAGAVVASLSGTNVVLPLLPAGTLSLTATVVDSRGLSRSIPGSITVLAYQPPKFTGTAPRIRRATSGGTVAVDTGAYARFDLTSFVTSLINTSQRNTSSYVLWSRAVGTSTWTSDRTGARLFNSDSTYIRSNTTVAIDQSRDYRLEIRDRFFSVFVDLQLSSGLVYMHMDGDKGLGLGKYRTNGGTSPAQFVLDLLGPGYQNNGKLILDNGDFATVAEAQTGTSTTKIMSPLRTKEAINAQRPAIKSGKVTAIGPGLVVGANQDYSITFPAGLFTAPPVVSANSESGRMTIAVRNVTTSGATLQQQNNSNGGGSQGVIHWIAMQE